MAFVPALLTGISALGGLFGNRPQQQQTGGAQQQTGYQSTSGVANATTTGGQQATTNVNQLLDPRAAQGYDALTHKYLDMLSSDPNLAGYQAGATTDINRLADIQKKNTAETLAARGVTGPAAAAALNSVESQRIGQVSQLHQQIPLLVRNILQQTMNDASAFFGQLPRNQQTTSDVATQQANQAFQNNVANTTGYTSQQGTVNTPGNMLGGLFCGAGNALSLLYGLGAFGNNQFQTPARSVGPLSGDF